MRMLLAVGLSLAAVSTASAQQTKGQVAFTQFQTCVRSRALEYSPLGDSLASTVDAALGACHARYEDVANILNPNADIGRPRYLLEYAVEQARSNAIAALADFRLQRMKAAQ